MMPLAANDDGERKIIREGRRADRIIFFGLALPVLLYVVFLVLERVFA